MDKQKQIEEMAKDMVEYGMKEYPTGESVFTETTLRESFYHVFLAYAEYLINKGYCRIHEGAVVLTREEVKKFANKISQAICDNTYPYFDKDGKPVNIWRTIVGYDKIDEIAKEFTGGKNDEETKTT